MDYKILLYRTITAERTSYIFLHAVSCIETRSAPGALLSIHCCTRKTWRFSARSKRNFVMRVRRFRNNEIFSDTSSSRRNFFLERTVRWFRISRTAIVGTHSRKVQRCGDRELLSNLPLPNLISTNKQSLFLSFSLSFFEKFPFKEKYHHYFLFYTFDTLVLSMVCTLEWKL